MTFPDLPRNAIFAALQDLNSRPPTLPVTEDNLDRIRRDIKSIGLDIEKCQTKDHRLNTRISRASGSINEKLRKLEEGMNEHLRRLDSQDEILRGIQQKLMQRDEVSAASKAKSSSSST